jgi:predicted nucleic acid-binding protein
MNIAELQQSINLFVEAAEKLQTDKSEAVAAAEEAAAAAARAEKEAGDVGGSVEALNLAATALKDGIDALVAELVGG